MPRSRVLSLLLGVLATSLLANAWLLYVDRRSPTDEATRATFAYNNGLHAIYLASRGLQTAQRTSDPVEQRRALLRASWLLHSARMRWTYFWESPTKDWVLPHSGPLVGTIHQALQRTYLRVDELLAENATAPGMLDRQEIATLSDPFQRLLQTVPVQVGSESELRTALDTNIDLNPQP